MMKYIVFLLLAGVLVSFDRVAFSDDKATPAIHVCRVYPYDKLRDGVEMHTVSARPDDLIQIHVPSTVIPKEKLRGIKVEIDGEAVVKFGVVVPVENMRKDDPNQPLADQFQNDIRCLLKAAKPGKVTVKITPIDKEGKEYPAGTLIIIVLEKQK